MSIKSQTPGVRSDRPLMSRDRAPNYVMNKKDNKMPLIKSASKEALGKNIEAEQEAGKPHAQAVAIGLNVARKAGAHISKPKHESVKSHRHKEHR